MWKALLMLLASILGPIAYGQYEEAAITGVVRDAQGLTIPQVAVQVKQAETGLIRSTLTSSAGVFSLNGLPLGVYTFAATHDGFREVRLADIRLAVGETRTLDVTLPI